MKSETPDRHMLAPREEREILQQIRNDHELITRLSITPQELEALSKCALLGTLTCKQDMLFILRQIREATNGTGLDQTAVFPQPAAVDEPDEDEPLPDFRRIQNRVHAVIPDPGSLESITRRRLPEQVGIIFWVVILVAGLLWNGIILMSRWRDNFMTSIGTTVAQAPASDPWYSSLDRFNVLLVWEVLFVGAVAGLMYLKSRKDARRFKVRPIRRLR